MKKPAHLILALTLVLSLVVGGTAIVLADQNSDSGSFDVLEFKNGDWQFQGKLSFSDYETLHMQLENDAGQVKVRLIQNGHDAAFVDYVALQKDAVTYLPMTAVNISSNTNVLNKVQSPEYDVGDAWDSVLEIVWDSVPENTTLVMRAMEEDIGDGHGGPLYYPYIPLGYTLSHTLVNDGSITVDGLLEEPMEPDFSVFWKPSSPHPDGYTYGWLHSDGEYLYAAVEVTADNTPDEEDWGAFYVLVNGNLKEFRVSGDEAEWGVGGFQYTSSVLYEHRIYEFVIPLSKINASIGDDIQYGFGSYGTVTATQVLIQTVPVDTGHITFDGDIKYHGDVVEMEDCRGEGHAIVAYPGPSYAFSEWAVEGHVTVLDPYDVSTRTCYELNLIKNDDGNVLIMVQTRPAVGGDVYPVNKVTLVVPWIALGVIILAGGVFLIRRRVHS